MHFIQLLLFLFGAQWTFAQTKIDDRSLLQNHELGIQMRLHTNGLGLGFRKARISSIYGSRFYDVEYTSLMHPKEAREYSYFAQYTTYKPYKINRLRTILIKYRLEKVIEQRGSKYAVELRWVGSAGLGLGLLQPVYLNIVNHNPSTQNIEYQSEKYNPTLHTANNIYGNASIFKGIGETQLKPSLTFDVGLNVDLAHNRSNSSLIEVGVQGDYFFQSLPLLAQTSNPSLFLNLYIKLIFGKRW